MRKYPIDKTACVLFLLFLAACLYGAQATVNSWNTEVYKKPGSQNTSVAGILQPGMVVNVEKSGSYYAKVSYKNIRGWVRLGDIVVYDNLFSNVKSVPVLSRNIIFENGRHFLFYYREGRINKYNVTERMLDSSQKVRDMVAIHPSPSGDLFLLEGIAKNGEEIHNYQFFHFASGKSVYIGSFYGGRVSLESHQFSRNGKYLAAVFSVDGLFMTCVYSTESGELLGYAKRARGANWIGEMLVLNHNDAFWGISLSEARSDQDFGFQKENVLAYVRPEWITGGSVESRVADNTLYIYSRNGVVTLEPAAKKMIRTRIKSLVFNPAITMNYYSEGNGGRLVNMAAGMTLKSFSGVLPETEFVGFTATNVIGRKKFEKIDTLFLFSDTGAEVYRYKSVEETEAVSENGIIADLSMDKNMMILSVEDPWKREFYLVMEKN